MNRQSFIIVATLVTMAFLALVVIIATIGSHNNPIDAADDLLIMTNPFVETAIAGTVTAKAKTPIFPIHDIYTVIAGTVTANARTGIPVPTYQQESP